MQQCGNGKLVTARVLKSLPLAKVSRNKWAVGQAVAYAKLTDSQLSVPLECICRRCLSGRRPSFSYEPVEGSSWASIAATTFAVAFQIGFFGMPLVMSSEYRRVTSCGTNSSWYMWSGPRFVVGCFTADRNFLKKSNRLAEYPTRSGTLPVVRLQQTCFTLLHLQRWTGNLVCIGYVGSVQVRWTSQVVWQFRMFYWVRPILSTPLDTIECFITSMECLLDCNYVRFYCAQYMTIVSVFSSSSGDPDKLYVHGKNQTNLIINTGNLIL